MQTDVISDTAIVIKIGMESRSTVYELKCCLPGRAVTYPVAVATEGIEQCIRSFQTTATASAGDCGKKTITGMQRKQWGVKRWLLAHKYILERVTI